MKSNETTSRPVFVHVRDQYIGAIDEEDRSCSEYYMEVFLICWELEELRRTPLKKRTREEDERVNSKSDRLDFLEKQHDRLQEGHPCLANAAIYRDTSSHETLSFSR